MHLATQDAHLLNCRLFLKPYVTNYVGKIFAEKYFQENIGLFL
jgi:hypothetical protein